MLTTAADERLAELAACGSEQAFDVLVRRHEARLLMVSRSVLRSDADAHDAVQNALLKAFSALQRGQLRGAPRPWLARIAHNEARSLARVRREFAPLDGDALGVNGDPHELVVVRERLATLVEDVAALPDRLRRPLLLRAESGLSYDEIAHALATTAPAARQAVAEARSALVTADDAREEDCSAIRAILAGPDRRRHRSRRVRGHLRACEPCRAWRPEHRRFAFIPLPGLVWSAMQWINAIFTTGSTAATAFRSTAVVAAVASGTIALGGDHHAAQVTPVPTPTRTPRAAGPVATVAPIRAIRTLSPGAAGASATPATPRATPSQADETPSRAGTTQPRDDATQPRADATQPRADATQPRAGASPASERGNGSPRDTASPPGASDTTAGSPRRDTPADGAGPQRETSLRNAGPPQSASPRSNSYRDAAQPSAAGDATARRAAGSGSTPGSSAMPNGSARQSGTAAGSSAPESAGPAAATAPSSGALQSPGAAAANATAPDGAPAESDTAAAVAGGAAPTG